MGLFDGFRALRRAMRPSAEVEAATLADVETVRRAIRAESNRLGRREHLSVSLLLEFATEDLRRVDLFHIIAHLDAEGEVRNVEQDSFGNLKFDVGTLGDADRQS